MRCRRRDPRARSTRCARKSCSGAAPDGCRASRRVAERALARSTQPSLRHVINATGVVLHTNLGRAPLAPSRTAARLQQSRIRSRHRPARQARRPRRPLLERLLGAPGHRGEQQRRGGLPGAQRTGGGRRSDRLARRTDRNRRRLPHPRDHGALRRRPARSGHHQPHRTSTITALPSTSARACCCASIPAISA